VSKQDVSRREIVGLACGGGLIYLPSMGAAQSRTNSLCPAGFKAEYEVWTETVTYEASLNISKFGGGGSVKMPGTRIRWKLKCTEREDPPPPTKPVPKSGVYDGSIFTLGLGLLRVENYFNSADLYFPVGLPTFAGLHSDTASLKMISNFPDGRVASHSAVLLRSQGGYLLSNPNTTDYWVATDGANASAGEWIIDNIMVSASASGRSNFGVSVFYGGQHLFGRSGVVKAGSFSGGTGLNDIQ
jgi:hypothetical protein